LLRKPLQIKVAGINNEQVSVADLLIVYYQKGWQSDTVLYGIVIKENTDMSYYILSPSTQLCGYNKLPFGIYSARIMKTEFLNREQFAVLLDCDGNTDIDEKKLSDDVRVFFNHNIANKNILPCEKGQQLKSYQKYQYYDNQFKGGVQWSITGKCNYRCKHCFMSANVGKFGEPSLEKCIKIIGEIADCGIKQVSITGGEPLIRGDFWQIIDELINHNILIPTIYTNGALVDRALIDGLTSRKIRPTFQISYDGPGWHDWLRGIDGAEKWRWMHSDCSENTEFPHHPQWCCTRGTLILFVTPSGHCVTLDAVHLRSTSHPRQGNGSISLNILFLMRTALSSI
jgi:hypothetical protein